jgi:HPt (histidine-containing phosphotransfer) domain-containing protein
LDTEALANLRRICRKDKVVREIIDLFLRYAPGKVADAQTALKRGDLIAIASAAHALRSSTGNLGLRRVEELSIRIETLAAKGEGESLPRLVQDLDVAFIHAKSALEKARNNLSS